MIGNFWKMWTGGLGRASGREVEGRTGRRGAKERWMGGQGADGRMSRQAQGQTSTQADKSGRGTDRAD